MQLTDELISSFQRHANIPAELLAGLVREADNDAMQFAMLLVHASYLDRDTAGGLIASQLRSTYVNLNETLFQQGITSLLDAAIAAKLKAIPLYRLGNAVTVGMVAPNDTRAVAALEKLLATQISPVFCFADEIDAAIKVNYQSAQNVNELMGSIDYKLFQNGQLAGKALEQALLAKPLVDLGEAIVLLALKERASDIHIESRKKELLVRFRIDGLLVDRMFFPVEMGVPLISRYKILAGMDITEHRKPQDGRFSFALPTHTLDLRVSTLPVMYGEKIVMRILGSLQGASILNLDKLDFSPELLRAFKSTLQQPQGIIFATGPTGSGKTTTLYAALNFINSRDINIVTIEDPVEYDLPSLNQVMVNDKVGRGFKETLRAVLRQDPDAILVGEIRDSETARIAAQAALTGHLVLTTLHTNDAIQASTRLLDMGLERYIVAPAIIGVLGQRLVRKLCDYCKAEYQPPAEELQQYFYWQEGAALPRLYRAVGCEHCAQSGYSGRLGVHEFLRVTMPVREAILRGSDYTELLAIAQQQGFHNMRYDGLKKVLRGLTSLEEVLRATTVLENE